MDSTPPDGPLAFGDFLEHLRRQGFVIGVGEYLRLQQLLDRIGRNCGPSDLKTLLCPILATNKLQQEQVYNAIDTFFDLFRTANSKARSSSNVQEVVPILSEKRKLIGSRKRLYVLAGIILLAVVLPLLQEILFRSRNEQPVVTAPPIPNLVTRPSEDAEPRPSENSPNTANPSAEQPNPDLDPAAPPEPPKAQETFYRRFGTAIHLSTIFAPLIFFIIFEWRQLNRRRLILEKQAGKKPPFVWPLKVKASTPR